MEKFGKLEGSTIPMKLNEVASGVKLAVDSFLKTNQKFFKAYIAPKLLGNFIVLKRIK